MKLIKAMATVAGLTGLSRIFGFIRDILMAAVLGAGAIADAFFVALKLPNFFRRVTAEGAFSVSFIPMYSEKLEKEGEKGADEFASVAFAVMLAILVPFTLLALWAMPWIIYGIAPGFSGDEVRYPLAVELSRVTFPYLLLMSLTALLGGVLNARSRFAPFAAAPILFNVCLIIALLLSPQFEGMIESVGHGLAWGVFAAGVVQFLWLLYAIKRAKVGLRLKLPRLNADIKKLFALMGPGVIGAGVMHINLFADLILASLLPAGSISYLYYADRLNQLPLGMVGIAVGTALLPMLSKAVAAEDKSEAKNLFNRSLEVCFLFSLPAAFAFFAISPQLVSGLFERGAFDARDAQMTAAVLMLYAVGLPAYIGVKVFNTAFWSNQDTMTPVKISIVITFLNIVLSIVLIQYIGVFGIALATGLVGWIYLFLMHVRVKRMGGFDFDDRFRKAFLKILVCSALMYLVLKWGIMIFGASLSAVPLMVALVFLGAAFYGLGILR
ncbi:MAG: murein biosynthesis integral membrane protein MurJ, partial [Pseudomonadota bacterium]